MHATVTRSRLWVRGWSDKDIAEHLGDPATQAARKTDDAWDEETTLKVEATGVITLSSIVTGIRAVEEQAYVRGPVVQAWMQPRKPVRYSQHRRRAA
ncbi:hypothetical protein [Leifsonia sp. Leaf264]|uniref:hypothetical protein n=1 Tax=Leifsonia sp. Leaf264 TaxID=1736314 RepID=UPI0012F97069|nr:hypothetical protein [Leifsonia sp. Leaf264]